VGKPILEGGTMKRIAILLCFCNPNDVNFYRIRVYELYLEDKTAHFIKQQYQGKTKNLMFTPTAGWFSTDTRLIKHRR